MLRQLAPTFIVGGSTIRCSGSTTSRRCTVIGHRSAGFASATAFRSDNSDVAQLVCPSIVGRDAELARLERCLAETLQGIGRLVVLSGEAGIGKTRLAREVAGRALAAGVRVRTDTSARASELVAALTARRAVERIELLPLADEEVEEVARLTLGAEDVPAGLVSALRQRASGVPFLIEEMLSAYHDAGGPEERRAEWWISRRIADALPPSYREVVRNRMATLETSARAVVQAAAVLGRSFDWRLLGTMIGADEREVLEGLRVAVRVRLIAPTAGLAPAFEFRHALAREAVLAELLPPERVALLARARVLAGDDLMAWMGVDDLLLEALVAAGKPERVRALGSALIEVYGTRYRLQGERIAHLHLKVARGLAPAGEWEAVIDHLRQAREAAARTVDPSLSVGIDALAARAALAAGTPERALELAGSAKRAAEKAGASDALF